MTRKARMAMVVPALELGGGVPATARFLHRVALESGQFRVRVISMATASDDADSSRVLRPATWRGKPRVSPGEWSGIMFQHVGARACEFEFQRYRRRGALDALLADCDLIQVKCGSPAWANAVLGLGKPVAVHVATLARVERRMRDGKGRGLTALWRRGMTRVTDHLDRRALQGADVVQVENPWMHDHVGAVTANHPVDVQYAPPGVDATHYQPLAGGDRLREPTVLCVGRLADVRKNASLLLQAFAKLPAGLRQRCRLVLAGSSMPGPLFQAQAEAAGLDGRIDYIHRPSDEALLSLYQRASVFALPSDEEGFGTVVVEAMACGVPVVATRCGGPDGIIEDGEDGCLVPLNDADAMAQRLQQLLEDDAFNRRMGQAARVKVERRYSQTVAGARFLDIWQGMLDQAGHR